MGVKEKLQTKVEKAKENIIINLKNQGTFSFILKWLFTNRVTVILVLIIIFFSGRYYYLRNEYLQERNKILIQENLDLLKSTQGLKDEVESYKVALEQSRSSFKDKLSEANQLSDTDKLKKIQSLVSSLKKTRKGDGIKSTFLGQIRSKLRLKQGSIANEKDFK